MVAIDWNPTHSTRSAYGYAAAILIFIIVGLHFLSTTKQDRTDKTKRYKLGMWRLIVGDDGRTSTSKVQLFLWTFTFFWALIVLLLIGIDKFQNVFEKNFQAEYLLLLGSPAAAAVIAKYITKTRVETGEVVKPDPGEQNLGTLLGNVVTDDNKKGDLGDFQYFMFNVVAIAFFYMKFTKDPTLGLPSIPPTLVGLTSVSALTYIAKKNLERSVPHLLNVLPEAGAPGELITVRGTNLVGAGPKEKVVVKFGDLSSTPNPQAVTNTATGDEVKAAVPAGANPGAVKIHVVTPEGAQTAEDKDFKVLSATETQRPQITRVLPEDEIPVKAGQEVTLIGAGFIADGDSPTQGTQKITLGTVQLEPEQGKWTATQILARLPSNDKLREGGLVPGPDKIIVYDTQGRPSPAYPVKLILPTASVLAADQPTVTTTKAAQLSNGKVTLYGNVNPKGRLTTYYFRYGPERDNYPKQTTAQSAGSGPAAIEVNEVVDLANLPGRSPGMLYHYQLVAANDAGTTYSDDTQFPVS